MGYVWNVHEVGMAYALILHELCQEIVGEAVGTLKETQKENLRTAIGKLWRSHRQTRGKLEENYSNI